MWVEHLERIAHYFEDRSSLRRIIKDVTKHRPFGFVDNYDLQSDTNKVWIVQRYCEVRGLNENPLTIGVDEIERIKRGKDLIDWVNGEMNAIRISKELGGDSDDALAGIDF